MSKKSNYWQERFLEEEERINKDARAYARRIEQQYDIALRNIERDINDWYMRIAKNNNVSLLEAKRMLSAKELAEFKWNVKEYIKAGETNAISPIWMKELENASARVNISRLEALKIQIQNEVEGIYGVRDKEMQNYLVRTYGETYYHTAFEIQKGNGVGWSLNKLDTNKVNTIIHKPWTADGKNFSERIWEDKTKLINTLHTGLTQNFIRGEAPDKLISSITKEFNIKKSTAARLVMTESAAYSSQAREKSFKALNLSKYEIVATLDSKTSEICQEMDGKVFDMKDYQVGVTAPPFHVWCRTTTAPWFPENYDSERIARGTDGKTYKIPGDMKYKDWKEKYVKDREENDIIKEKLSYEEEASIYRYIGSEAYILNEALRNGEKLNEDYQKWMNQLDKALKKVPKYDGIVTRSLEFYNGEFEQMQSFLKEHAKGKIIRYPQYTSSTIGEVYNPQGQIQLNIISKSGRDISTMNKMEKEILFERNKKFKVIAHIENDGKYFITMEELDE